MVIAPLIVLNSISMIKPWWSTWYYRMLPHMLIIIMCACVSNTVQNSVHTNEEYRIHYSSIALKECTCRYQPMHGKLQLNQARLLSNIVIWLDTTCIGRFWLGLIFTKSRLDFWDCIFPLSWHVASVCLHARITMIHNENWWMVCRAVVRSKQIWRKHQACITVIVENIINTGCGLARQPLIRLKIAVTTNKCDDILMSLSLRLSDIGQQAESSTHPRFSGI